MPNHSTKGLTLNNLLGDVRKNNNFVVHISNVTDTDDGQNLDLIIQKAFLPQVSLQVLELRHGNDSKKLAGVATWQGGQITILDTLSRKELDAVLDWFHQTYDTETGAIGLAKDYKKDGTITEYAADGRYAREWQVNGMWISDINLGELDAESGEQKRVQFTVQIDPSPLRPTYRDTEDTEWSDE